MNDASHNHHDDARLAMPPEEMFDLMADRAAFGLDDAEAKQLDEMLGHHAWVREDCLDEVAAELAVEFESGNLDASMPAEVAERIRSGVHATIAAEADDAEHTGIAGRIEPAAAPAVAPASSNTTAPPASSGGVAGWLGWVAAAAAIAVAVMVSDPIEPAGPADPQTRAELVAWIDEHPSAVHWDWSPGLVEPDDDATGLVTFDPDTQQGYMLIKGLAPNDPRFEQYQLWIWDQDREPDPENPTPLADNVHPVDGGVFDVNGEGEAVIPIRSSLVIGRPYLFAVTVERPGGVAKSAKERVPIIAAPKSDA